MDVTTESFEGAVLERSRALPVVVDFWAGWCGPCHALAPVLEREVEARAGAVELVKVDVDAEPALARQFAVQGIPAVKAFRNGHVVAEFVGAQPAAAVARFLDGLTGPTALERIAEELTRSGELPLVAAAAAGGDEEAVLALLVEAVREALPEERERLVRLAVDVFADLGTEHPVASRYRRELASVLF